MSFSIDPAKQLQINEAVVRLGEQLEKAPESFFYGLSDKEFDLCERVRNYVQPVFDERAEFESDDKDEMKIFKANSEENLKKEFQKRGIESQDVAQLESVAKKATAYKESTGLWVGFQKMTHFMGSSKQLHERLHQERSFAKTFHGDLEKFKQLTEILKSKIGDPGSFEGFETAR